MTTAAFGRSETRTSPSTSACVASTKASIAPRAGLEPEPLVDELGPALLEPALDPGLVLGQDDVLERRMRLDQDDRGRGFVDLAALDPDGAVLDHVEPPIP